MQLGSRLGTISAWPPETRSAALDEEESGGTHVLEATAKLGVHTILAPPLLTSSVLGAPLVVARHLVFGFLLPDTRLARLLRPHVHTLDVTDLVASPARPGTEAPGAHHPLHARIGVAGLHLDGLFGGGTQKTLWAVHSADPLSGATFGRALTPVLRHPVAALLRVARLKAGGPRARTERGVDQGGGCGVGYRLAHHLPCTRTATTLHGAL